MEAYLKETLKIILCSIPPAVVFAILLLFFPEKIEKWSALLWKCLANIKALSRSARKQYIKHDLQGRVNDFSKRMRQRTPGLFPEKLDLEWVDASTPRSSLLADGRILLRLRAHDPEDHNFVHASYLYISRCLLRKTKRYLSSPQRDALDVFVASKLLREEKPEVVEFFLDEYLYPKTEDAKSKTATLVDDFAIIDNGGLFFPLLLQELEYLGDKVFGRRREDLIAKELYDVVGFLRPVSQRTVGDQSDLDFDGSYCRFAVVIIGKPSKLLFSIDPYVTFIRKKLVPKGVDTIYLLARSENKEKIDSICVEFDSEYTCGKAFNIRRPLRYPDHIESIMQYLVVLRRRGADLVKASGKGTQQEHGELQDDLHKHGSF
jgi:hypothetical protein